MKKFKRVAFTLAEVLITLGIIGVVAAMTLPTFINNIQERIRTEQVRNVKYKLTQATDSMKSLGLLHGDYPTTTSFVNELQKHYKIIKVCDSNHIADCWPTDKINKWDGSQINVSDLKKGSDLLSLGLGTKNTETVGIVTADGTPIIMTYSPRCTPLDAETTYSWSTVNNKPETNATTNCISAIFDINGKNRPNRIGKDVRTFNSILGYQKFSATAVTKAECEALKKKNLINECYYERDTYAGAVKKCNEIGLHLPSLQTLAVIAGATYGRSDIGPYTLIMSDKWAKNQSCCAVRKSNGDCQRTRKCDSCEDFFIDNSESTRAQNDARIASTDRIICLPDNIPYDTSNSAIGSISDHIWANTEISATRASRRAIRDYSTNWADALRDAGGHVPLCVGD